MADIAESSILLSSAQSIPSQQSSSAQPTSSGQHVLMKDQSKIKAATRYTTIVVNSRDRNYLNYPNSNNFRYTLRRPLTNVHSIELMSGSIPAFIYTINQPWNSFIFQEGLSEYTLTLTPGSYTESTLCSELQTQLNTTGKLNRYQVILNVQTRKLEIKRTGVVEYSLLFYSGKFKDEIDLTSLAVLSINTPARLLGFGLNDYISDGSGNIFSPLPMDIENFLTRIYLHVESDGRNLSRMELGAGRPDCFHIFYLNPGTANYLLLNKETDHSSIFTSSPAPISRVANLEISLRDEFNRPVDLQYRELNLVFEIIHLE
jgi:hypothetical protein